MDEKTRDYDVQQYEDVVKEALVKKLKAAFSDEDIRIYLISVGIAREKYVNQRAT